MDTKDENLSLACQNPAAKEKDNPKRRILKFANPHQKSWDPNQLRWSTQQNQNHMCAQKGTMIEEIKEITNGGALVDTFEGNNSG